MTNTKVLKEKIESSGMKVGYIAIQIGITPAGLYKKLRNKSEFKASEIMAIARVLNLTSDERDAIFFDPNVA